MIQSNKLYYGDNLCVLRQMDAESSILWARSLNFLGPLSLTKRQKKSE